jgi:trk system potassium uptake protein TrkA
VILLEEDAAKCERAAAALEKTAVICGSGVDADLLAELHASEASFFIGVSEDDQSNLMAGLQANRLGAHRVMVLTSQPDYVPVIDSLDIDVAINSRLLAVEAILAYIRRGPVLRVAMVGEQQAEAIEMRAMEGAPVVGRRLADRPLPSGCIAGLVISGNETVIPGGSTVIKPGDRVVVFALSGAIEAVQQAFRAAQ